MTLLVLSTVLFLALGAVLAEPDQCPSVKLVHDFKVKEFTGKWYEIQRYPSVFEPETKCVTADYRLNMDGSITMSNSIILVHLDEPMKMQARGIVNKDNPANITVEHENMPGELDHYLIVDTDYKNYALIYECKQSPEDSYIPSGTESAWILSRTPYMSSRVVSKLTKKLQIYGSDVNNFKKTDQINCDY